MIDAILFSVRDITRESPFGYGVPQCDLTGPDGMPPPRCGSIFVSVYGGDVRNDSVENLDEYFTFFLKLTMRVTIAPDRVGDQMIAKKLAQKIGFNARCEQLRALFNKNWQVVQRANQTLVELNPQADTIYGFCESPIFGGRDAAQWVGPDWFSADPSSTHFGLVSQLRFDRMRRIQRIGSFV